MYLLPFLGKIDCICIYCLLLLLEKFNERVVLYILLSPATQFDFLWFLLTKIPTSLRTAFYSPEDINDLPMEFQNIVATLAGNINYRHSNSSVARITVDNIF